MVSQMFIINIILPFFEEISIYCLKNVMELQTEVKHLVALVEKLTSEFAAIKEELEASRVDVDSMRSAIGEVLVTLLTIEKD